MLHSSGKLLNLAVDEAHCISQAGFLTLSTTLFVCRCYVYVFHVGPGGLGADTDVADPLPDRVVLEEY